MLSGDSTLIINAELNAQSTVVYISLTNLLIRIGCISRLNFVLLFLLFQKYFSIIFNDIIHFDTVLFSCDLTVGIELCSSGLG